MMEAVSVTQYRRRAKLWGGLAGVLVVVWLGIWLGRDETVKTTIQEKSTTIVNDVILPSQISQLSDLSKEVPVVSFEAITKDLRNYPDEFKDKRFFEANKNKWTVQVMDVAEHKLITDYLQARADRERFTYFRYLDTNNKERYILTYGVMQTFQEALGATKVIDFKLPNSARVLPEQMVRYLDIIDGYEYEKEDKHEVVLDKTTKVVAPKLPKAEPKTIEEPIETSEALPEKKAPQEKANERPKKSEAQPEPVRESEPVELAAPPTIRPTADAQARPIVPLNQAAPTFDEGSNQ